MFAIDCVVFIPCASFLLVFFFVLMTCFDLILNNAECVIFFGVTCFGLILNNVECFFVFFFFFFLFLMFFFFGFTCFGLVLSNVESVIRPEVTCCLWSVKIQEQTNKKTNNST